MSGAPDRTLGEIQSLVASGRASAVEICREHLERARSVEPRVRAFRLLDEDDALRQAESVDSSRRAGSSCCSRGVLPEHGGDVPPPVDLPQPDLPARNEAEEQYQRGILVR